MSPYVRYTQIALICLMPLSLAGCMTAYLAEQVIAQVKPMPAASWYLRFKLEGVGQVTSVVMQAPGKIASVPLHKMSNNDFQYSAPPGTSLDAQGTLEFTFEADGREPRRARLDLALMLTEPLHGEVRIFAKPEHLKIFLYEYTGWKRASYNTNAVFRATRPLRTIKVPYLPATKISA